MSYARFGADGSQVYVFLAVEGWLECCGCGLQKREWVPDPTRPIIKGYFRAVPPIIETNLRTTAGMLAHLDAHRAAGQTVPDDTYAALRRDADDNDARMALP